MRLTTNPVLSHICTCNHPSASRARAAQTLRMAALVPAMWITMGLVQAHAQAPAQTHDATLSGGQEISGSLQLSQRHANVGDDITATLTLQAEKPQSNVEVSFSTGQCLLAPATAKPAHIKTMARGTALNVKATFTVTGDGPCFVSAQVVRTKNPKDGIVYGAVFGATLNPNPNLKPSNQTNAQSNSTGQLQASAQTAVATAR